MEELANRPQNVGKAKVPDHKKYAKPGFHDLTIFHKEFTNTDPESEGAGENYLGTDKMAVQAALEKCEQYEPWTMEKCTKWVDSCSLMKSGEIFSLVLRPSLQLYGVQPL